MSASRERFKAEIDIIKAISAALINISPSKKVKIPEYEDKCENILDIKRRPEEYKFKVGHN